MMKCPNCGKDNTLWENVKGKKIFRSCNSCGYEDE